MRRIVVTRDGASHSIYANTLDRHGICEKNEIGLNTAREESRTLEEKKRDEYFGDLWRGCPCTWYLLSLALGTWYWWMMM